MMRADVVWTGCLICMACVACTPEHDWRVMQPPGLGLAMTMPCRPASQLRQVHLDDRTFEMTMFACADAGMTFSLGSLNTGDPTLVGSTLSALTKAARSNIQARTLSDAEARVPGMTPHPLARQMELSGHLHDGRSVNEWLVVFSKGTRVYQALVLGNPADAAMAQQFANGLKVLP